MMDEKSSQIGQITQRLLKRNGTHFFMPRDTSFARGSLADQIGKNAERATVEDMIKGSFTIDKSGLDEV